MRKIIRGVSAGMLAIGSISCDGRASAGRHDETPIAGAEQYKFGNSAIQKLQREADKGNIESIDKLYIYYRLVLLNENPKLAKEMSIKLMDSCAKQGNKKCKKELLNIVEPGDVACEKFSRYVYDLKLDQEVSCGLDNRKTIVYCGLNLICLR